MRSLATLAIAAIALTGCGTNAASSSTSASSAPAKAAAPDALVVHAGHVDEVMRAVAHSSLSLARRRLFAQFIAENRKRPETYDGQTVGRIVNLQIAYEDGLHDVEEANATEEAAERQIDPLLDAEVLSSADRSNQIVFTVSLHNKSAKTIKHADIGVDIFKANGHRALAHIELNIDHLVAPHSTATFQVPVYYRVFDNDASVLSAAANQPKTFGVDPDGIEFTDGTHVGLHDD